MKIRTAATAALSATLIMAATSASAICGMSVPSPMSTVTPTGSDSYAYAYTLTGESGSCVNFYGAANFTITAFELPYFADAGVTAILSPTGWTAHIDATDAFGLGSGAETLVWTAADGFGLAATADSVAAPTLSGFGYTAGYSSVYAPAGYRTASPYLAVVDPALPGSPQALAAGLVSTPFPVASSVPEPSAALALLAGLGLVGFARRRA